MSRPQGPCLQTQLRRPGPKAVAQRCQWSLTQSALPFPLIAAPLKGRGEEKAVASSPASSPPGSCFRERRWSLKETVVPECAVTSLSSPSLGPWVPTQGLRLPLPRG